MENKCPKCKSDKIIQNEEDLPFSVCKLWECLVCGYTWEE